MIPFRRASVRATLRALFKILVPDGGTEAGGWRVGTLTYTTAGLAALFFWLLLGDFALELRNRSAIPLSQLFLERQGASDTLIALLMTSVPPAITILIAPVVSYHSDRARGPYGRRIPYLLLVTPVAALAMVGIAFSAEIGAAAYQLLGGGISRSTCVLSTFGVFWVLFEGGVIVSGMLFAGLINDVVPSSVIGRFFGLFRTVSLLDAILFNYVLLALAETHFVAMFLGIAAVFGVGTLIMTLKVREGSYPPLVNAVAGKQQNFPALVKTYVRECYSHPYYLLLFSGMAAALLSFAAITSFQLLYAKQLHVDLALFGKVMAGCAVFSLAITMPLGVLADRFHPLRLGLAVLCAEAVVTALAATFIRTQMGFLVALVAQTILSSCYYTATASLPQRLFPRSRFSQFQSASSALMALVMIPFGPLLGAILDRSQHNYRLTFAAASVLSVVAALILFGVYRRFLELGGPEGYRAPGEPAMDLGIDTRERDKGKSDAVGTLGE